MKKLVFLLLAGAILGGCVSYKPIPRFIDTQKLPELSYVTDTSNAVKLDIQKTATITGLPEKAFLAKKSQYVIPLPFVGFFGGKLLMKPGDSSLASPLFTNLDVSLHNEMAASYSRHHQANYTLKVKVDSSNFSFGYKRKGFVIWLFIVSFGNKKEWCSPRDLSLSVSYELLKDGVTVKKGAVTKTSHNEEKILSNTPMPQARPYDPNNPADSPSNAMVRQQDAFAFGGIGGTVNNGLQHAYLAYNELIVETARQVVADTKESVK